MYVAPREDCRKSGRAENKGLYLVHVGIECIV